MAVPDWAALLRQPELPFEVDVGTAHGDFLLARAEARPDLNLIGLELRKPFVDRVNARIARRELPNAHVVRCNANFSFGELFPARSLRRVYVHFPDPWFKKRHHKRRVMTPDFVRALWTSLNGQGELRFMTDYAEYAAEVQAQMVATPGWENPFGAGAPAPADPDLPQSHREEWHVSQGHPVHRYTWRKVE